MDGHTNKREVVESDCAPRPYHGGFTLLLVPKFTRKACIQMRLLNSYRACNIMRVFPFSLYWPFAFRRFPSI